MQGPMSGNEPQKKSFWATAPGLLTAIATVVTAIGGLIAALAAAGVFRADDGGIPPVKVTSEVTSEVTSHTPTLGEAVLRGEYTVTVTVKEVTPDPSQDRVWVFSNAETDQQDAETWTLNSICPTEACDARWDSVTDNLSGKFGTLHLDRGTYAEKVEDLHSCGATSTTADRSLALNVAEASNIAGVWTATRIAGTIRILWQCTGQAPVRAVMDVEGARTGET